MKPALRTPLIFDGHNDILSLLYKSGSCSGGAINLDVFAGDMPGHLDMDKMRKGGFGGGFFAIGVPSPIDLDSKNSQMNLPKYDLPLPPEISVDEALPIAIAQAAILHRF